MILPPSVATSSTPSSRDTWRQPLALGDLEGVGLCTEQRSVGLPVGLCVHARNVGDVLQGRAADLDHCCGELQKDTQGCTIL